jgi:hypothetical protein
MTNPYAIASGHLNSVLTAARSVRAIASEIEAVPELVKTLQAELTGLQGQLALAQRSLASEKKAFEEEWHRSLEDRRHTSQLFDLQQRDLSAKIEATQAELRETTNQLGAAHLKVERLAKECRRCERWLERPTSAPSQ